MYICRLDRDNKVDRQRNLPEPKIQVSYEWLALIVTFRQRLEGLERERDSLS